MMLLQDVLWKTADTHPHRIAFDAPDGVYSYEEFVGRVRAVAGALQALGVTHGDRVSILAPNIADYMTYHYAVVSIGAILHVLNTRHVADEMIFALNDAGSSGLIVHERFRDLNSALRKGCHSLRFSIGIGQVATADYASNDLIADNLPFQQPKAATDTDTALLIYTSGTTGQPKGACQTHRGSLFADDMTAQQYKATADDIFFAFMPYFHQAGLIRTRALLSRGGQSTMMDKPDPDSVARFLIDKRVSITMLVPPYDTKLIEIATRDNLTLDHLRLVVGMGGLGPDHAARITAFCDRAGCDYMGIYGQTEVTGSATGIFAGEYAKRPTSCGRPLPGVEMQIWDEDGMRLPDGEVGEMVFRSPGCIPQYWRNRAASQSLYRDGWLQSGDLAWRDADGYAHFVDRCKELIKTGGENVYPAEVRSVVITHPAVRDLAVLGVRDAKWGETVAVAVVTEAGATLTLEDLRAFCRGKLGGYKIPTRLALIDEIPRSFSGKIEKLKLKAMFE